MGKQYLVGFDAGTNSCRCSIYDVNGKLISNQAIQISPKNVGIGRFMYSAIEYRQALYDAAKAALQESQIDAKKIAGISFSSQRGALVMYDKNGELIDYIIAGSDARWFGKAGEFIGALAEIGVTNDKFLERYGFMMHLGTTASLAVLKEENPEIYERIHMVGNIQLLLTRSFGGNGYYDEWDDGGTTLAYGTFNHEKQTDILGALGLNPDIFSPVYPAGTPCGRISEKVAEITGFAEGTPVFVGTGDQMCNDIGAGCVYENMSSLSMGTIGVLDIFSTTPPIELNPSLSVNGTPAGGYLIQGMCGACGGSYKWMHDNLCDFETDYAKRNNENAYEVMNQTAAGSVPGAKGLIYQPFLGGAMTYGNYSARGGFLGLGYSHSKADMVRAVMEGVAYELRHGLDAIIRSTGKKPEVIRVTGGGRKSALWMQTIADILKTKLVRVESPEVGTLGAAMIAAVSVGIYKNLQEAAGCMVALSDEYVPNEANYELYDEMQKVFDACYNGLNQSGYAEIIDIQNKG